MDQNVANGLVYDYAGNSIWRVFVVLRYFNVPVIICLRLCKKDDLARSSSFMEAYGKEYLAILQNLNLKFLFQGLPFMNVVQSEI